MFTKNLKPFLGNRIGFTDISGSSIISAYKNGTPIISPNSASDLNFKTNIYLLCPNDPIKSFNNSYHGVSFGTGSGTPTVDDVTLFGDYISEINTQNMTYVMSVDAADGISDGSLSIIYTISNTSGADMTIGEIGFWGSAYGYTAERPTAAYRYSVLLEHTALDTPITIPAGGVGQVTYTISMKYPTFE